jgi:hypothetical protein
MSANDKFGLAAGALALGLAAGAILIMQFFPQVFGLPSDYTRAVAETIFDAIVCLAGLATGIYLFYQAARTKNGD